MESELIWVILWDGYMHYFSATFDIQKILNVKVLKSCERLGN